MIRSKLDRSPLTKLEKEAVDAFVSRLTKAHGPRLADVDLCGHEDPSFEQSRDVQILVRAWVNSSGDWLAEVDTDAPSGTDNVVLLNGTPILREGDPVSAPGGTVWVIDGVDLNEFGQVIVNHLLIGAPGGSSGNEAVYLDGSLIALEGDAVTAPQATAGTNFVAFDSVALTDTNLALLRGFYNDHVGGDHNYHGLSIVCLAKIVTTMMKRCGLGVVCWCSEHLLAKVGRG